jgi:hypothetical protein
VLQNRHLIALWIICSPQYGQGFVAGAGVAPTPAAAALAITTAAPHPLQKPVPSATALPQLEHVMFVSTGQYHGRFIESEPEVKEIRPME